MEEEVLHRAVYIACAVLGATARGFIAGLFPAAVALKRGHARYAWIALAISVGVSQFFHVAVSVLTSIVLLIVILRKAPAPSRQQAGGEG